MGSVWLKVNDWLLLLFCLFLNKVFHFSGIQGWGAGIGVMLPFLAKLSIWPTAKTEEQLITYLGRIF